jgi:hypothetical protein
MSTVELPQVVSPSVVKRKVGRPKKVTAAPVAVVEVPVVPEIPEAVPARNALMLGEAGEASEPVEIKKPSRARTYGNKQEVWDGLYKSTKSGLTKEQLGLTKNGKVVSLKQLAILESSIARIRKTPTV